MKNLTIVLLGFLSLFSLTAYAQTATVKKVQLAGNKVIVFFDLEDSNPKNEYQLSLYSSKDNFAAPLLKVTGDIGSEVKPGTEHSVEWNISEEYPGFNGRLSLEIRGKIYLPFVKLQNFDVNKSYKRGKQYELGWKAGTTNPVHVELFKGSQRVQGDMNHPNSGVYTMNIPASAKPGDIPATVAKRCARDRKETYRCAARPAARRSILLGGRACR